jgi:DNA (cytosine-5)-methyltransferase 1
MDVTDEDAKKILEVNSDTQAYKQAGNSIVVSVMVAIFKNLFLGGSEKEQRQLDIFDIL